MNYTHLLLPSQIDSHSSAATQPFIFPMKSLHAATTNDGPHVHFKHSTATRLVSIPVAPELCPPHWRRSAQRSIRRKLKLLALKTFHKPPPFIRYSPVRPNMRFKDSDDYLTARGANPRTGQISPSVVSDPKTPDTPGAALKAHALHLLRSSPSPTKRLHGIRLANEGKKLKEGETAAWLATGGTFRGTDSCDLVLPTIAAKSVARKVFLNTTEQSAPLGDDDFLFRMPSAREPQPYNFPGLSGPEIQAFEHYKHKADRTSSDGYDKRLLVDGRKVSDTARDQTKQECYASSVAVHAVAGPTVAPLNVVKRRQVASVSTEHTFVPYKSPQSQQKSCFERSQAPRPTLNAYRNFSPESLSTVVSSSLEQSVHDEQVEEPTVASDTISGVAHLNQLPRVRLVHPSKAATPSSPAGEIRHCSLGCSRNSSNNTCIETRKASLQSEISKFSFFADEEGIKAHRQTRIGNVTLDLMEMVMIAVSILWQSSRDFLLAHASALSRLFPQDMTTWEKLMIVKSLFWLLVQITAISIVVALMWKVAVIIVQVLNLVFWPLSVIVRAARWAQPTP
ncbi:hypothetical protein AMS68_006407 [Peltaster fructicola]|uniref:Uncharacterized protein n=1 Tax=Peltaster fructicola TaxID=286661 RepID=A0A6H0Y2M7_9PEZI|nr:hypothetical protein AMS68_006407 [Peltaster fructicola]